MDECDVERCLGRDDDGGKRQNGEPVVHDVVEVDQQPDGQEEDEDENGLHRIGELDGFRTQCRIGDDQPRDEGAVNRREAKQRRRRAGAKAQCKRGKRHHVRLAGKLVGKGQADLAGLVEIPDQRAQKRDGQEDRDKRAGPETLVSAQRIGDDQHRHDGDVLGDQHADGDAARLRAQFADIVEHLDRDSGRGQRHDEGEDQDLRQVPAEQPAEEE